MYFLLILVCIQMLSSISGTTAKMCDEFQPDPPMELSAIVENFYQMRNKMGEKKFYERESKCMRDEDMIDAENTFHLDKLLKILSPETLNSPDLTPEFWQIVRNCSSLKGDSPVETATLIHKCIDAPFKNAN
ncbi:uncharacterized protein LOC130673038 [Microplitis mediator]|uniref:uncharacterized protein LOC130673038 n=1 Tax=Microplitis mediator TaxID=375433 RepID=UPI002556258B|nr:uncharacterized protein LOC130673038 [Microplitis mediator]